MHHLVEVFLELGLLIGGLGLLGAFAGRFGVSAIPLYLLAGLAFGDGGLHDLADIADFLDISAEIGIVLLLFALGLEYTPRELTGTLRTSWRAAIVDLVLNASPGVVCGLLLGWGPLAATVMGGVTYVSSSGIIAKVLSDLGWLGNRETPTVLSLLVAEDLVMAVYLPIVTTILAGLAFTQAAWGLAMALLAVGAAFVVASRGGTILSRFLDSPSEEVLLLKVLGLILVVAGLAEQVHVSAAVGAFFVGMALSGEVSRSAERILEPLKNLFAAIFFVNFGLQTNPQDLPPVLVGAVVLAAATVASKFVTGWWAAGRAGSGFAGRLRAGLVLLPRGEFSIVIAGLGVSAGLDPQLGTLAAAYVLMMAAIGPIAPRLAGPIVNEYRKRTGARKARASASTETAALRTSTPNRQGQGPQPPCRSSTPGSGDIRCDEGRCSPPHRRRPLFSVGITRHRRHCGFHSVVPAVAVRLDRLGISPPATFVGVCSRPKNARFRPWNSEPPVARAGGSLKRCQAGSRSAKERIGVPASSGARGGALDVGEDQSLRPAIGSDNLHFPPDHVRCGAAVFPQLEQHAQAHLARECERRSR